MEQIYSTAVAINALRQAEIRAESERQMAEMDAKLEKYKLKWKDTVIGSAKIGCFPNVTMWMSVRPPESFLDALGTDQFYVTSELVVTSERRWKLQLRPKSVA